VRQQALFLAAAGWYHSVCAGLRIPGIGGRAQPGSLKKDNAEELVIMR